jgi:hypothetical protein
MEGTKNQIHHVVKQLVEENSLGYIQGIIDDWTYLFGKKRPVLPQGSEVKPFIRGSEVKPFISQQIIWTINNKSTRILSDVIEQANTPIDGQLCTQLEHLKALQKELSDHAKKLASQLMEKIESMTEWKLRGPSPSLLAMTQVDKVPMVKDKARKVPVVKNKVDRKESQSVPEEAPIIICFSSDDEKDKSVGKGGPKPVAKTKKRKQRGDNYRGGKKKKRNKKQRVEKKPSEVSGAMESKQPHSDP